MIIEYIGEVIRTEVSEIREKQYEARVSTYCLYREIPIEIKRFSNTCGFVYYLCFCLFFQNRGIYMFRLDEDRVVDATLCGGLARYINHSCNPNCVTEIVEVDRELRIIIFAKRRINRSEEVCFNCF